MNSTADLLPATAGGASGMEIPELTTMSVKELRALRARVDDAIRAQIAKTRVETQAKSQPADLVAQPVDLERERDLWKARRG